MKKQKLLTIEEEFQRLNITENQFGPILLSRLGKGLYKNELHCVREYIQNSVDGINKFNREYSSLTVDRTIRIDTQGDTIIFYDNGIGMNKDDILTAISFGVSLKEKIYDAGFLGIGIFSGGSLAEKARIYTTKKGEAKAFVFEIDFKYIEENYKKYDSGLQLLKDATRFQELDEDKEKHYCQAILYVDKKHRHLLKDETEIRRYISLVCPVGFDNSFKHKKAVYDSMQKHGIQDQIFDIKLNRKSIFRPFPTEVTAPTFRELRSKGKLLAVYWYCESATRLLIAESEDNDDIRYITYRWRNFLVDDPNRRDYTARELFAGRADLMKRYFGDIHILDLEDIEPDLERTGFRHTSRYEEFKKAIQDPNNKGYILDLRRGAYTVSSQSALIKLCDEAKAECQQITKKDLTEAKEEELWKLKINLDEKREEIKRRKTRGKAYTSLNTPEKSRVDKSLSKLEVTITQLSAAIEETKCDKTKLKDPAGMNLDRKVTFGKILKILKKHLKDHGSIYNAIVKDLKSLVKGK